MGSDRHGSSPASSMDIDTENQGTCKSIRLLPDLSMSGNAENLVSEAALVDCHTNLHSGINFATIPSSVLGSCLRNYSYKIG